MEYGVSEGGWPTEALVPGEAKAFSSDLFLSVRPHIGWHPTFRVGLPLVKAL